MHRLIVVSTLRRVCSTQLYVCVDNEGQSHTRLNVLHADAVQRHTRPSGDQLANMEYYYYYSQSASIITPSNLTVEYYYYSQGASIITLSNLTLALVQYY